MPVMTTKFDPSTTGRTLVCDVTADRSAEVTADEWTTNRKDEFSFADDEEIQDESTPKKLEIME
jgi:hypothetical protein